MVLYPTLICFLILFHSIYISFKRKPFLCTSAIIFSFPLLIIGLDIVTSSQETMIYVLMSLCLNTLVLASLYIAK